MLCVCISFMDMMAPQHPLLPGVVENIIKSRHKCDDDDNNDNKHNDDDVDGGRL